MKKFLSVLTMLIFILSNSCKKELKAKLTTSDLTQQKSQIALLIKKQLDSTRLIVQANTKSSFINKSEFKNLSVDDNNAQQKVVYYDTRPVKDYFASVFNLNTKSTSAVKSFQVNPNDSGDIITITADSYDPTFGQNFNVYNVPNNNVVSEQLDYINNYINITKSYTDLNAYTSQLNNLENTIYNTQISDDSKTSLTYQIELLKYYANDIETNQGYYEGLCNSNNVYPDAINNNINNYGVSNIKTYKTASGGCHVDVRGVLTGAVVSGFTGGVAAGYAGATTGSVAFPIIGTVTGGASGFMAGFAVGFVGSVVGGTVAGLLSTCFH